MAAHWQCDCTRYSTVMVCADCGARYAAPTRDAAQRLAVDHDRRAHPDTAQLVVDMIRRRGAGR